MVTNTMPFREDGQNFMIVDAQRNRRYTYPPTSRLSSMCRSSIDNMMTFNPMQRPSIKRCCYLPWFHAAFPNLNIDSLQPRHSYQQQNLAKSQNTVLSQNLVTMCSSGKSSEQQLKERVQDSGHKKTVVSFSSKKTSSGNNNSRIRQYYLNK